MQTGFSQLGPNPETLALYNNFLQGVGAIQGAPFDPNMMQRTIPWTAGQDAASNYQIGLGMQGMPYGADAAALLNQGAQSTVGQIPGVASSLMSPWANQAVNYGQQQGQNISNYATNLAAQGPQLEKFSQAAIDRYMSPYINDVVNATQGQFTNANAQQGNALLGQGIRAGNAFGGDRAGVAAAQLGNQQQLAQAPVIAGLYDKGYNTALGEFNTQNALATQLGQMAIQGQLAGGQLGMQGYGLGLNAAGQANALAAQALGQNQNAALQGGAMLGQLGGLQYSQNLAGGAQANQAAQIYPAYLQNLYATQAANAQMANAYPFQTSSWYGGLLQGIGGLTGTQQQNVNAALSNYLQNVQGTQITNKTGSVTPPQPNSFLQAAGLGLAGLGLFANRGGAVPRMPRRAMGGGIPRYAAGGPMPGPGHPDLNFLTGGFGDAIQPRPLQATHLAAPNTTATDIKLPVLSTLTFPGMSSGSSSASASTPAASSGTLGEASALLGNKQVASGLKSIGSSLFGNNDVSVSTLGGDSSGGQSETTNVGLPELNGGFRRGGIVAMRHYPSGGYVDEEQPAEESPVGNWVDSLVQGIPEPYADDPEQVDDQPQPQPSVDADEDLPADWTSPESDEVPTPRPGPEQRDEFVPDPYADELAQSDDQPQPMSPSALGQPEGQAGLGPEQGGGRGGRGRPERINFPGQQGRPQGFLSRWASNPLTQFGLGLASAKGAGMTGVAEGLRMGLNRVQAQQIANDKLDKNYKLDTSGDTTRLIFPTHAIDTKLPTGNAARVARQRRGVIPAGMMLNDAGVLVPMPVEEAQKAPALQRTAEAPAAVVPQPEVKVAEEDEGGIPVAASLTQGLVSPVDNIPEPTPITRADGKTVTSDALKVAGEQYAQTGKLPQGSFRDQALKDAVINHGSAILKSRGISPRDAVEMWRFAPRHAGWLMGKDGRDMGSLGTVVDHLDTMRDLTTALNNGDNQTYNLIKNKLAKWTGKEYPTNVEAGAHIVGSEIMKAIGVAGAGTGAERDLAAINIGDLSKSPAQFAGTIDATQRLIAGQMNTKYRLAESIGVPAERVDKLVGKRALQVLKGLNKEEGGGAAPVVAPATPAEAKPAAPSAAKPTGEQQRALDWANSHPDDPRAAEIKKRLGQ